MMEFSFSQWVLLFTFYSVLGWLCETVWCSVGGRKLVNRGFLSGPWCPVYGFGAIIILLVTAPFAHYPVLVFLAAMLFTSALEYFTGWLLETLFKARWWDYSSYRFQLKGRVCLRNSLLFGLLGLCAVYLLQPWLMDGAGRVSAATQRVLASVIVVVLFFDLLHALAAATNLEEHLAGLKKVFAELEQYQTEHGWHAPGDFAGNLRRLREASERQPADATTTGLLARVQDELKRRKGSIRLVRAFPTMRPQGFSPELAALKEEWGQKRREYQHRQRKVWAALKTTLETEREKTRLSYKGVTLTRMVWVFLIGSVIGYVVETAYCLLTTGVIESRQGMVYGPFNQVYGFGAVLMVLLLTPLAYRGSGWLFGGGAVVGGLFEAACSLIQETFFGSVSWEYSGQPFALLGGRTNLLYMLFWGALAMVYMRQIYPRMAKLIDRIPKRPKRFFTLVTMVFLSANMLLSAMAVGRWSQRDAGIPAGGRVAVWLDTNYPDAMLEEIYPNMQFVGE